MKKTISLEALNHNLQQVKSLLNSNTELMAVVKTNAYGHGIALIAPELQNLGVQYFGVANLDEAIELRELGITKHIMILSGLFKEHFDLVFQHDFIPSISTLEMAHYVVQQAEHLKKHLTVHIKVDTGMSRCGFLPHELTSAVAILQESSWIEIEGIYSHWATADEVHSVYAQQQEDLFWATVSSLNVPFKYTHMANSAGVLLRPSQRFNMVRVGILLYGQAPCEALRGELDWKPVMSWQAQVMQLKTLPAGVGVSYGLSYQTNHEISVAIVTAGYGDGLFRELSNQGNVLINGQKRPIIGTVCMDFVIVQLEPQDQVLVGDEVCILGRQGSESIDAMEMARQVGTIPYEVLCRASQMQDVTSQKLILK